MGPEDWNSSWYGKEGFPHSGNSPNATDWFFLRTDGMRNGIVLCDVTFKWSPAMPCDVVEEEDSDVSHTSPACPHIVAMMTLGELLLTVLKRTCTSKNHELLNK